MHRVLNVGSAAMCVLCLAAFVEAAPQKAKSGGTMTLTGCLEKGGDANTFKLTHVADEAGAATKTAEAMKPDWELIGAPASLKLSDHVGHKVTVTGTGASADAAAKTEGKTGASAAKESMERHLKVSALKHVAATCP